MNPVYRKNLEILKKANPEFALKLEGLNPGPEYRVLAAKKEGVYLEVEGIPFNSRMAPLREAVKKAEKEDFSERDLIILGGLEAGYTLLEMARRYPEKSILAVEQDWNILKKAMEYQDFTGCFQRGKVEIIVPREPEGLYEYLALYKPKKIGLLLHRPSYERNTDFYKRIQDTITRYIATREVNQSTLMRFEKLWFKNMILNMGKYLYYNGVDALFKQFENVPAFLIGAGPSLQKQLPLLKAVQRRYLLIAVNTSMPYLIKNGIVPDFVVTVDPQDKVYDYFLPLFRTRLERYPILVAEPTISPKIVKNYPGPVLFSQVGFLKDWILSFSPFKDDLETGGSVITTAFSMARKMKASPIVFVGTDMAYTGKTLHFRGAELEKRWLYASDRILPMEDQNYRFLQKFKLSPHEGFFGDTVYTDVKFLTYINWLEKNFAKYPDLNIINATEGGIRFQHIRNEKLDAVLKEIGENPETAVKREAALNLESPEFESGKSVFVNSLGEMEKVLPGLQQKALEGEKIAERLYEKVRRGKKMDSNSLEKLNRIDREIVSFPSTELLSLSIQKVIHEVSEQLESQLTEEEKKSEELKVLKYSLLLYRGVEESAGYALAQIRKCFRYLEFLG